MDCQRCRQPLLEASPGPGGRGLAPLGESYVVLPQSRRASALHASLNESLSQPVGGGVLQASSIHDQLQTVDRLVGLAERCASLPCGVPLCEDCASGVVRDLNARLRDAREERDRLQAAFAELEAGDGGPSHGALSDAEFAAEEAARELEVSELRAALASARRERSALADEAVRLRAQRAEQEAEEEAWHAVINGNTLRAQAEQEEATRERQLVQFCRRELARLGRVDVVSDVFRISSTGSFGTLNSLRLGARTPRGSSGRLPGVSVALLLVAVARESGARFSSHALLPMGSYSKAYKLDEPRALYELHGSGSPHLGRIFGSSRFDKGLTMLLACASDLLAFAGARPRAGVAPAPPHPIEADAVGGFCIRLQASGGEERWTRALRCLLEDLSWLLTWRRAGAAAAATGTALHAA
ncbi:hypothetical protein EMIHUDRAFT_99559 [Emiliania huxleyi CCMP1516]|uniref:Atg6 BARA domain-containing protein n=2 Tax=Emiliania huxleyi TaxID=2903 RepID=A0A0D3K2V1_EMIH1|nr:hypothetical protein EMIHUDRAFT_99559 [Emiliania huxleyi CCMP1516]EOD30086.1 hypothetical protein EMIHUDRAFT_99559 [Emiliania huxleyi CCMP1516]|eukprot:XP_005782515.1 hypothetical protein EMIHUDRAFT_99559 [Emiliania huxleyi CCMP1516]